MRSKAPSSWKHLYTLRNLYCQMEIRIDILKPFFREPAKGFLIREVSKMTNINHTTVRKWLLYYAKEGMLNKRGTSLYDQFYANPASRKFLNLKVYHNLEAIRESGIVETIERSYNFPPIALFGSYAKGEDDQNSDIDICVISDINREIGIEGAEKTLGKEVSIHHFTRKGWTSLKKTNPHLVNGIANGIVLSGQLEVL